MIAPIHTLRVRARPHCPTQGIVVVHCGRGQRIFPCALGRSGIGIKRGEGDGVTPLGEFALLDIRIRAGRWKQKSFALPSSTIQPHDGWCDEAGHGRYNKPIHLPFNASHEAMWRDDHLYDALVVMDYNVQQNLSVGGSAIFFHLAREGFTPTEGCVAVDRRAMEWILPRLTHKSRMVVG